MSIVERQFPPAEMFATMRDPLEPRMFTTPEGHFPYSPFGTIKHSACIHRGPSAVEGHSHNEMPGFEPV